jgi:hypothetical protein
LKWFKHFADAHDDERLVEILEQFGLEGVGFWWMLCEIVAYQMDETDKCEASYPVPAWSRKFYLSVRKTNIYFTKFSEINLIICEYDDSNCIGKLKIKIPKLLEFRDNYSKKVRTKEVQCTDSVRPKKEKKKKEVEGEEIKTFKPLLKGAVLFPICKAWKDYVEMRKAIKKPMTVNAEILAAGKLIALQNEGQDPIKVLEQSVFHSWQGLFEVKPDRTKEIDPFPTETVNPRTIPGNCKKCGAGKKKVYDGWECKKCGNKTKERGE